METSYQYHFGGFGGGFDFGGGDDMDAPGDHKKDCSCVEEYATNEEKNYKFRP